MRKHLKSKIVNISSTKQTRKNFQSNIKLFLLNEFVLNEKEDKKRVEEKEKDFLIQFVKD